MRHTGLIHPKFDLKLVLKMGDAEMGVLGRFTLRFTREMAVQAQIRKKRKTPQEKVFRSTLGRGLCISSNLSGLSHLLMHRLTGASGAV